MDYLLAGELSLDGSLRPVNGILPMVYDAHCSRWHFRFLCSL
ncbi:MAG: magnesium chelatase domain-containing protein [Anaerotignum sp.]